MKKFFILFITAFAAAVLLQGCASGGGKAAASQPPAPAVTQETALEGVTRYCRSTYDWSAAEEDPSIMYVEMGEETESEYQVIFRSYTGAFVYFHVDKASGTVRMTEYVPALDIESEAGSFELFDYLETAG